MSRYNVVVSFVQIQKTLQKLKDSQTLILNYPLISFVKSEIIWLKLLLVLISSLIFS